MFAETHTYLALLSFAVVASITPGPNNLMVMASGAAFGWRKTVPHMAGIALGFAIMIGSVALGLSAILEQFPQILSVLRVVGAAWLLWLAWQLASPLFAPATEAESPEAPKSASRPMHLYEAAMFQWVNPKAWTMAVAASAAYSGIASDATSRAVLMAVTFIAVAPVCNSVWVLAGQMLQRLMTTGNSSRIFSLIMVALVVLSALVVLAG